MKNMIIRSQAAKKHEKTILKNDPNSKIKTNIKKKSYTSQINKS